MNTFSKYILVIEDNHDMRDLIKMALRDGDHQVEDVGSAKEAFSILNSGRLPAIILLDMHLSDMDGAAFMKGLREISGCEDLKVVVISGIDELKNKAAQIGAQGFVKKPFDLDQLYKVVERHLASN